MFYVRLEEHQKNLWGEPLALGIRFYVLDEIFFKKNGQIIANVACMPRHPFPNMANMAR
jgi:hypothetical protein